MKYTLGLLASAGVALVVTTGCKTHVPMVWHEPATYQRKADAAKHWDSMASEIAGGLGHRAALHGKTVFLPPVPEGSSTFDIAYANLLKVKLIQNGWQIAAAPDDARVHLSFESLLISHGNRGFCVNPTTFWNFLGLSFINAGTGDSLGSDWSTRKDLLVTFYLYEDGKPIIGGNQIVYVPSGDKHLYSTQEELEKVRAQHARDLLARDPFSSDWAMVEQRALAK